MVIYLGKRNWISYIKRVGKMRILIINGPNLNLLGKRERDKYGDLTLNDINEIIKDYSGKIGVELAFFQSNHEGELIDKLHNSSEYNGVVINPGAYTHYSYAIRDAISSINIPVVEVHLTNIHGREEFRSKSVIAPVTIGQISGFGLYSYILGIQAIKFKLS